MRRGAWSGIRSRARRDPLRSRSLRRCRPPRDPARAGRRASTRRGARHGIPRRERPQGRARPPATPARTLASAARRRLPAAGRSRAPARARRGASPPRQPLRLQCAWQKLPLRTAAQSASRCVSRASSGSSGSRRFAAALSRAGVSLPRVRTRRSERAAARLVRGRVPRAARSLRRVSRRSVASSAPTSSFSRAAARARVPRCAGSGLSSAARSRNAAAAATPPRA